MRPKSSECQLSDTEVPQRAIVLNLKEPSQPLPWFVSGFVLSIEKPLDLTVFLKSPWNCDRSPWKVLESLDNVFFIFINTTVGVKKTRSTAIEILPKITPHVSVCCVIFKPRDCAGWPALWKQQQQQQQRIWLSQPQQFSVLEKLKLSLKSPRKVHEFWFDKHLRTLCLHPGTRSLNYSNS